MSLKLGDQFPNFTLKTTVGEFQLHEWLGNKLVHLILFFLIKKNVFFCNYIRWGILFSHPADYTPVCTTELSRAAKLEPEFAKRNTQLIGLSCDSVENHTGWIKVFIAY
jgi:1-Cys peroxiredoxin 6